MTTSTSTPNVMGRERERQDENWVESFASGGDTSPLLKEEEKFASKRTKNSPAPDSRLTDRDCMFINKSRSRSSE